ncbi:mevalonate kinase [Ligilactobacillus salitolerans]|uniref:Mevalonate kinase n=1 Tax=Ligilactobacillus salitolerans TaxID=1808352 RepID=A0A401IUA7_9LACO|nr:mevalonate kinase [Ligilactobacillus salitolerans]GBG95095.1 mevalonate kinase [Ligilactobacillus salitolerans]
MKQKYDGIGKSHAKIILIGEHSVVYGKPAIALPLPSIQTQAYLSFTQEHTQVIKSSYFDGPLDRMPHSMEGLHHLIITLLKEIKQEDLGFTLTIRSQLPAERGMGSSAAAAVAVIRCFYDAFSLKLTHAKTLHLADISEKDTHKNPSGLDAATVASQRPVWMIRGQELTPLPLSMNAYLLICDSGIKGQTSAAIKIVQERFEQHHSQTQKLLDKLGSLTSLVKEQLAQNDVRGLGNSLNTAQRHLSALGVSTQRLDFLIKLAQENGSLGSKLTGGGRGGCFINLINTRADAEKLAALLEKNGVTKTWIQPLSSAMGGL